MIPFQLIIALGTGTISIGFISLGLFSNIGLNLPPREKGVAVASAVSAVGALVTVVLMIVFMLEQVGLF